MRQVDGCQGFHNPDTKNDVLVIGSGYDHLRISDNTFVLTVLPLALHSKCVFYICNFEPNLVRVHIVGADLIKHPYNPNLIV